MHAYINKEASLIGDGFKKGMRTVRGAIRRPGGKSGNPITDTNNQIDIVKAKLRQKKSATELTTSLGELNRDWGTGKTSLKQLKKVRSRVKDERTQGRHLDRLKKLKSKQSAKLGIEPKPTVMLTSLK